MLANEPYCKVLPNVFSKGHCGQYTIYKLCK